MNFSKQINDWIKGDIFQGKIMVSGGILLGIAIGFILNNVDLFIKGMLYPFVLLFFANIGYGTFLLFSRPKQLQDTQELFEHNPQQAIQKELEKAEKDDKVYTLLKPIWLGLLLGSIILWFVFSDPYWQGVSVGLIIMSIGGFFIDFFLHRRLKPYLDFLKK